MRYLLSTPNPRRQIYLVGTDYASILRISLPHMPIYVAWSEILAAWDGRCYAHTNNIDEFFRTITRSSARNLPDDVVMGDEGA